MGVLRGANLVGMSSLPLDVCPGLAKKNKNRKSYLDERISFQKIDVIL